MSSLMNSIKNVRNNANYTQTLLEIKKNKGGILSN